MYGSLLIILGLLWDVMKEFYAVYRANKEDYVSVRHMLPQ